MSITTKVFPEQKVPMLVHNDPIPLCISRCIVTGLFHRPERRSLRVEGNRVHMCILGGSRRWEIFAYQFPSEMAASLFAALVRSVGAKLTDAEKQLVSINMVEKIVARILTELEKEQP